MSGHRQGGAERILAIFTDVRGGEAAPTLRLALRLFLVLFAYYLLKPTREALILEHGGAELRSYAIALQALVLMVAIPAYSLLLRRRCGEAMYTFATVFFVACLGAFWLLGRAGADIGFPFFVWLGIFSVMQVAQFWALAAHLHSVEAGQRLFALVALGGSLGAVAGARSAARVFEWLGPYGLIVAAACLLLASIPLGRIRRPAAGTATPGAFGADPWRALSSGFRQVLGHPYLRLIALFVVLLNCINSTGEFILARFLVESFAALPPAERAARIGAFYGDFFFWVNILSLGLQAFAVSRIYRAIGVGGALMVLPLIAASGYALLAAAPVFALVRLVKIIENSTDYSLQSTTRHALFLPVDTASKFEGKTTIDTFFWRLGDLGHAGLVWLGSGVLGLGIPAFAGLNLGLSLVWIGVAALLARHYRQLTVPAGAPASAAEAPPANSAAPGRAAA